MRFTLLCASAALAASLVLAGCSTTGSSSAIPGGSSATSMAHHSGLHIVMMGGRQPQSCPSPYNFCYEVNPANGGTFEWCIVNITSGNCTSNLAPGKWKWTNTAPVPGKPQTTNLKTGRKTGAVKSTWSPVVGNPTNNVITTKATLKYTKGKPGYAFSWQSCAKSGPYKGSCVGPVNIGIILGNY